MQEPFEVYGLHSTAMDGDAHLNGWQEVQQFMSELTDVDGTADTFAPHVNAAAAAAAGAVYASVPAGGEADDAGVLGRGKRRKRASRPYDEQDAPAAATTTGTAATTTTAAVTTTPLHTHTPAEAAAPTAAPKRKRSKAGPRKRKGAPSALAKAGAAKAGAVGSSAGSGGEEAGLSKKQRHILSEQRRRKTIADKFNALRDSVPGLESHDNKVAVLTRTVEYLHDLQRLVRAQGLDAQRPRDYLGGAGGAHDVDVTSPHTEYAESDGTAESSPASDAAPASPVVAPTQRTRTRTRAPRAAAAAAARTVAAVAEFELDSGEYDGLLPTMPQYASSQATASGSSDDDERLPGEDVQAIEYSQMLGMVDTPSGASSELLSDEEARLSGGDSPPRSPSSLWQGDLWGDARKFAFVFCVGLFVFIGDLGLGLDLDGGAAPAPPGMTARVLHAWSEPDISTPERLVVAGGALYSLLRQAMVLACFGMFCVVVMLTRGGKRHGPRSVTLRTARAERTCAEELTTSHSTASEKEARFLKVLGLLGIGLPHSRLHVGLGIAAQGLRMVLHLSRVGVWLDRMVTQARGASETLIEAQAALHGYYLIKTRDARLTGDAVYALLASLNYGECVGPSAELVEAYGSTALLLESNVILHWTAPYFRARATDVEMRLLPEERKSASVHRYEAYVAICQGPTMESERALGRYHEMCLTSPKHSFLLADCWSLFAILYTFQGRHVHALKVNHAIHEKALRSQEAFFQLRSLLGMARCLLELGETERAMVALNQIARGQLLDSASARGVERQVYHAVLGLAHYRLGDSENARHHARIASDMGTGKWQYRVFHFLAYASSAEVRLEMLEDELDVCSLTGASCGVHECATPTTEPAPLAMPAGGDSISHSSSSDSGGGGGGGGVGCCAGGEGNAAATERTLTPLSHKSAEATSSLYDSASFDGSTFEGHVADDLTFVSAASRSVCNSAYKDLANLRRFARQYPVALAYAHRLHGRYYFLKRMHNQSLRCFQRGISFAQQYNLPSEERECRATLAALRPYMKVTTPCADTQV